MDRVVGIAAQKGRIRRKMEETSDVTFLIPCGLFLHKQDAIFGVKKGVRDILILCDRDCVTWREVA